MTPDAAPVLTAVDGHAARITLNRPRALNALTPAMIDGLAAALDAWEHDPAVRTVVLDGAGERGLCAGADIRLFHADARSGDHTASEAFLRAEYRLDSRIAHYPKPYVALMDGIVMGGGVGLSAHGAVRVVTERSKVAMPEVSIGLVPDVGGTYLLARAPGELGTHLALTGLAAQGADAVLCGLADHFVPSDALPDLLADLAREPAPDAVARHARPAPEGALAGERSWIDACYAADTVEEIVDRLFSCGEPAAKEAAETLLAKSPSAVKATLESLRRAARLDSLEAALDQEFRVSCAALDTHDLPEGIRAQIIDKDRDPHWRPATLAEVTPDQVERYFTALGERELGLA
ncbi:MULTISPECIES: enoyl-CoA hydratase/isomerase family protein [unclassified Streptomyces]|uniref:enoyl-CoA hydratase/isomerase family protein n=1 Tax=unclassified Streptomyces TaxID=2593676 RepID=UPI000DB8FEFD|nr:MULTISPECIES: enoyl-CoA hydratase/isomerase family protein [unclassified Streptomyces]MYT69089.1 enoyl-CoA hydratase/isomerase family protein [Streptomyces sp. SID8367]RAJ82600.1 enoyl-CoA hydratase [Streptomyces sp. PsTaAH-137]